MRAGVYRRAFARAIEILGGKEQLASHLGVDSQSLGKWSAGSVHPPVEVLQSLAEILRHEISKDWKRLGAGQSKLVTAKKRSRR
jgi:DNA-binding XRE family transcriptional regulator